MQRGFGMTTAETAEKRYLGRRYLWAGIVLAILGPVAYALLIWDGRLFTPWSVPIVGTLGVVLVFTALAYARSVVRVLALVLVGVLAAGEWTLLLKFARLPAYAGPVEVGKPLPPFETRLADGSRFEPANFTGKQNTLLVFFRGRG